MVEVCLRAAAVLAIALSLLLVETVPARASCIQQTQADQIARADVIAYGRVTSVDRGAGTLNFRALAVYKGDPGASAITVQIGPGPRGFGAATSVDYRAEPGDHLLYLQRQGSDYTTNDCSGSHPGPATADEQRLLAAGTVIAYSDPGPEPAGPLLPALVGFAAVAVVAAFLVARRRAKAT